MPVARAEAIDLLRVGILLEIIAADDAQVVAQFQFGQSHQLQFGSSPCMSSPSIITAEGLILWIS
jgi:hypothetical protein